MLNLGTDDDRVRIFFPGPSQPSLRLLEDIERVASSPARNVWIEGERGAGKELVARAVHGRSVRGGRRFVAVRCAMLDPAAAAAELTRATASADVGTIYLDALDRLAPATQASLAHELAGRKSAGAPRICAWAEGGAAQGSRVREDLLYRLNGLTLRLPSLRERRAEIGTIAAQLLAAARAELGRPPCELSHAALRALEEYSWPGNLRELELVIARAALIADDGTVEVRHLLLDAVQSPAPALPSTATLPLGDRSLRALEEALIRRVLDECDGNRSRCAQVLGINRATLYNKLKSLRIA